jgi:hypothetical protein
VNGLLIRNCQIANLSLANMPGLLAINNYFLPLNTVSGESPWHLSGVGLSSGQVFLNNIFNWGDNSGYVISSATDANGLIPVDFRNNVFAINYGFLNGGLFAGNTNASYNNMQFSNNLFLTNSSGGNFRFSECEGCSFNNNIIQACTNCDFINVADNSLNNLVGNINSLLVNYDGVFELGDDVIRIADGSAADNAGTDGTDIGPFGGEFPFVNDAYHVIIPNVPYVTNLSLDNIIVPQNVPVQLNATGRIYGQ